MNERDIIRRVRIEHQVTGVREAVAGNKAVADSNRELGSSATAAATQTENSARRMTSVVSAFDRLERKSNLAAKALYDFERAQRLVGDAVAQNSGLQLRADKILEHYNSKLLVAQRLSTGVGAANDNMAKKIGLSGYEMRNLGFQVNDFATMLAMGASPFQVLASQGGQVLQILQGANGGVTGALKDMAARTTAFLGPLGLMAVGLTAAGAAAYGLYSILKTQAPDAEKLLAEHDRLLRIVKDSYDKTANSARNWFNESKNVTQLQLLQQEIGLREKLTEATIKGLKSTVEIPIGGSIARVKDDYKSFADAIYTLNEGWQKGTPNVRAFVDEVARISLLNPSIQKLGADLIANMGDASKFATTLQQTRDLLNGLKTGTFGKDERDRLGFGGGSAASVNAYESLIQKTKDRIVELQFEATAAGQTEGAVRALRLQHEAERAAKKAGVSVNQVALDQMKQEIMLLEQQEQRRDALKQAQDAVNFDRATMFMSPNEQNVAGAMQSIYRDNWQSQMDSHLAMQMRLNNSLREYGEIGKSAFTSVAQALRDGKITTQEWASVLENLSSRLMDIAANSIWDSLIGGRRGGGGLLGGLMGNLFGGGSAELPGFGTSSFVGPLVPGYAGGGQVGGKQPVGIKLAA